MRRLIWVLIALPVLLIAAAFLVPALIDWTDYRERIEARVAEVSGLRLSVNGGIAVNLLPEPRLRLQDVVWSAADGEIATVPQIEASLSLSDLLEGEARVERLSLVAPQLSAGREARFLEAADSLLAAPLLDSLTEIEIAGAAWSFAADRRLVIDRLLIERSLRGEEALYSFDLLGEAWLRALTARGSLSGLGTCAGPIALEAQLEGVLQQSRVQGEWRCGEEGVEVSGLFSAQGPDLAALLALAGPSAAEHKQAPLAFSLDGPLDWQNGLLDAPSLSLGVGGQEAELRLGYRPSGALSGEIRVPLLDLDGPDSAGLIALAEQSARLFAESLRQVSLDLLVDNWRFRGASGGQSTAALSFAEGQGRLGNLRLALPNASSLGLTGTVALGGKAEAAGRLEVTSEDLRGLLLWLGIDGKLLPPERLRRLSLHSDLSGSLADLRLQGLLVELDALTANGAAAWQAETRHATLQLAVDALNLDAYGGVLLADALGSIAEAVSLDLAVGADSVTLEGMTGERLDLAATIGGGVIALERLRVEALLDARLQAAGRLSLADRQLALDLDLSGPLASLPVLGRFFAEDAAAYRLAAALEGPLPTPAIAGQLDALDAQILFSGLLDAARPQGDWAVSLQHPDLQQLLDRFASPLRVSEQGASAVDLSALLRFGSPWSLQDLSGVLGPLPVLGGSLHAAQNADGQGPMSTLVLSLGEVDGGDWEWGLAGEDSWTRIGLALSSEPWPLQGRLDVDIQRLQADGWVIAPASLRSESAGPTQASLSLRAALEGGLVEARLARDGTQADLDVSVQGLPLAHLVPPLSGVALPAGDVSGEAKLSWQVGGLPRLLESLSGRLTADGRIALVLDPSLEGDIPPARVGQRILQALVGDAAGGLARIANLTAGVVRLLQRVVGQDFALTAALSANEGRIAIETLDLRGGDILATAFGWIDLASWQIDATWLLRFSSQGGEPYYRERRSGPLGAADILRDGLLFRGVTPPN
ncbi:MAG: AsmA family protein [Kiloniellales bacterium]